MSVAKAAKASVAPTQASTDIPEAAMSWGWEYQDRYKKGYVISNSTMAVTSRYRLLEDGDAEERSDAQLEKINSWLDARGAKLLGVTTVTALVQFCGMPQSPRTVKQDWALGYAQDVDPGLFYGIACDRRRIGILIAFLTGKVKIHQKSLRDDNDTELLLLIDEASNRAIIPALRDQAHYFERAPEFS